ncbi:MAG: transglutaminase domain-containing protein [Myxococcota bacterium]
MLRFLAVSSLVAITTLGVWLASSLIAYAGGPAELAVIGGVLLFPVLPLWWEKRATDAFYARLKRATRLLPKKRALTWGTRVALRTVVLNLVFLAALLVAWPKIAFAALATRGDWFLDGRDGARVDQARAVLVSAASGLEWLHRAASDNPYRTAEDERTPVPDDVRPLEVTTKFGSGARWRRPDPRPAPPTPPEPPPGEPEEPPGEEPQQPEPPPAPTDDVVFQVGATTWPWAKTVHPVVAGMTAADETSPEAVARYVAARTTDPFQRVKALHDWVVTRLRYDEASVKGPRKPQDARTVFDTRLGVCEGYARLLVELGRHSGDRIVYVTGEVREEHGELAPVGHAWNAVQLAGAWYLLDATWDDPVRADGVDTYRTDYLFIPPQLAGLDHFPDDVRWQLRDVPLSRAQFLRQPLARPGLAREGLVLRSPAGPIVDVADAFTLRLENPARVWVMVSIGAEKCGPSNAAELQLDCRVPRGADEAVVFTNRQQYGSFDGVASFKLQ